MNVDDLIDRNMEVEMVVQIRMEQLERKKLEKEKHERMLKKDRK